MNLPPDPEQMNDDRAEWAYDALRKFAVLTGQDLNNEADEVLGDLLCDLMHWCDRNEIDFDERLEWARGSYGDETRDENA